MDRTKLRVASKNVWPLMHFMKKYSSYPFLLTQGRSIFYKELVLRKDVAFLSIFLSNFIQISSYNLIKLCWKKKLLNKRAKKSSRESHWVKYRKLNDQSKKECNSAWWQYTNDLAKELKSNTSPKPFWNYIKSKRKGSSNLVSIKVNDEFSTWRYCYCK